MRSVILAIVFVLAGADVAMATCSEDAADLNARIGRDMRIRPSPQVQAAAKEMRKLDDVKNMDEVDCYNVLARARRALKAPPPPTPAAKER